MKYFLILTILFTTVEACQEEQVKGDAAIIIYTTGDTSIELREVRESRCPSDVTCVWEGNVAVDMIFKQGGAEEEFTLHSAQQSGPQEMDFNGLMVRLIDVLPYPVSTQSEPLLEDYEIVLEVR